jgi:2-C-methyl-D-erythritol 4-phosphate cytidylyltransferase
VFNSLKAWAAAGAHPHDWVLVHDAARCLATPAQIGQLVEACRVDPVGGLLALKLPDTLKQGANNRASHTVPRDDKWLAQTPQMFRLGELMHAMEAARRNDFADITDEASAMEAQGQMPLLVPGTADNFKVTYPPDFALAQAILRSRTA